MLFKRLTSFSPSFRHQMPSFIATLGSLRTTSEGRVPRDLSGCQRRNPSSEETTSSHILFCRSCSSPGLSLFRDGRLLFFFTAPRGSSGKPPRLFTVHPENSCFSSLSLSSAGGGIHLPPFPAFLSRSTRALLFNSLSSPCLFGYVILSESSYLFFDLSAWRPFLLYFTGGNKSVPPPGISCYFLLFPIARAAGLTFVSPSVLGPPSEFSSARMSYRKPPFFKDTPASNKTLDLLTCLRKSDPRAGNFFP